MSMSTNLSGRLRNTALPKSHVFLPLFEAVVNAIQAVEARHQDPREGRIEIEILRVTQMGLPLHESKTVRAAELPENILGFRITDNGVGFHAENMRSFETLDSDYKAGQGCRGIGRLLWLKSFAAVHIKSVFEEAVGDLKERSFTFTADKGVSHMQITQASSETARRTCIHLDGIVKYYREALAASAHSLAQRLLSHCLWYFIREEGAPRIEIQDGTELIDLSQLCKEFLAGSFAREVIDLKGQRLEICHLRLHESLSRRPFIAWCAAHRVVEEENIAGSIPGLHGKLLDEKGDFIYACYVTSPILDICVKSERTAFQSSTMEGDLFGAGEIRRTEMRDTVLHATRRYLQVYLEKSQAAGRERVERFVARQAPRYRPILHWINEEGLSVDPGITDRNLNLLLHKHLCEFESQLLAEGHDIMQPQLHESMIDYQGRLAAFLDKVDALKKSDLASYVAHRKLVLDIFAKAIQRGSDGKYAREEMIHQIIMPMRLTSNEIRLENCNLWLIDERLAFHDYLASDKPLSRMPITPSTAKLEPDICALNAWDEPVLVSDSQQLPPASLVVVEIKRPMGSGSPGGKEKCPIEQALRYLERIRQGGTTTASGRIIPKSADIPGFCYVLCDLTPAVIQRCKMMGLRPTSDHLGYFGHNDNFRAYVEVVSFDRLLNAARERNRVFFDKLGLPTP